MTTPRFALALVLLAGCMPPPPDKTAPDLGTSHAPPTDGAVAPSSDGAVTPTPDGSTVADLGPSDPCASVTCGANSSCSAGVCSCASGYELQSGTCQPSVVGDPSTHSQADVCGKYRSSGVIPSAFFSTSTTTCDRGSLTQAGIDAAVARINYHRWLAGLAAVSDDPSSNGGAQGCAMIAAWNPAGSQAHEPPSTSTCYNSDGAGAAGMSNIAWGCGDPVDAIDQWIQDDGNSDTMGHRRWLLNPPLDPIGFGLYVGGNNYGSAACVEVFGQSGTGPNPDFVAYPPAGYVPLQLIAGQYQWTFASNTLSYASPTVTVKRMSDDTSLAVTIVPLDNPGGFNYTNATSFVPSGWQPAAGETYTVTVSDGTHTYTYAVKPVTC